ncbi:hypothetical protein [Aurantiacibacter suaedae]|uniref:hypothetical protein n=1 Tax=Aurantiacibacter suaedae TaxID=2545755 RepID=UPI0010F4C15B|nr:hypothetical protein [Aurantiacibacter suaedae]
MAIDPRELLKSFNRPEVAPEGAPFAGTRAQKVQRLQVGIFGLVCMILVVALADIVVSRADQTEASVVSKTGPSVEPTEPAAPRDPLADAGVVPELPIETGVPAESAQPTPSTNAPLPAGVAAQ